MTDRGLFTAEADVCPFVAFEDDRDARADRPDHRHRCFAESRPAPRALAHQEAYCLASAFPSCPTFQDWARREAARARSGSSAAGPGPSRVEQSGVDASVPGELDDPPGVGRPGRGWTLPPPWAQPEADAGGLVDAEAPAFLAGRLRPSQPPPRDAEPGQPVSPSPTDEADSDEFDDDRYTPRHDRDRRGAALDRRPRVGQTRARRPDADAAPTWERPRRHEAYPTLRTRVGLPNLPRIVIALVALAAAAAVLFFLPPMFLGLGQGDDRGATASPSVVTSPPPSPEPSPSPAPTAQTYVIQAGDTLSKIAKQFGVSIEEILAANKETITNPDRITEGQEIVIPVSSPEATEPTVEPEPSPSP